MRPGRFPLSYVECRDRFRGSALAAGRPVWSRAIAARGPSGEALTLDAVRLGPTRAPRALVVLSGVHGVEGFSSSVTMCDALERWAPTDVVPDRAVLLVHGVNPWGMAWWRRQNESNVDLNRNWARDTSTPRPNPAYVEVHAALCPDGDAPPSDASLLAVTTELIERHGYPWLKAAVTEGQYTHPEGLYFGGERTEESVRILTDLVAAELAGAEEVLVVDLHTGHGRWGACTLLTQVPEASPEDAWLRDVFSGLTIENTTRADATTPPKRGQLAPGLADVVPGAVWHSVTMEIGTGSDTEMILAERAEHWVHRCGDRSRPEHASIVWRHRELSCPDDPEWEAASLAHGRRTLDAAHAWLTT